jgi:hypothetical protein
MTSTKGSPGSTQVVEFRRELRSRSRKSTCGGSIATATIHPCVTGGPVARRRQVLRAGRGSVGGVMQGRNAAVLMRWR